ncbi:MAG: GIDE domain-containing protein [Desulfuromonas sp.]|nr:GIDE domain-containing protein [Desulfuromonas sp.]
MQPATQTEHLLLVMASSDQDRFAPLIKQLATAGALDSYTLRQRLIGVGLAQLAKGTQAQLQPLAQILRTHAVEHWLLQPTPPSFSPQLLNGVEIDDENIVFSATSTSQQEQAHEIVLNSDTKLLAVVADISGQLADKQLKRLMVHNTYSGKHPSAITDLQLQQDIFKFTPLIDLYWLDEQNKVSRAVRIFPGSFDHRQLGANSSLSRNGNLLALLETIKERAGSIKIDYKFGLGFLPCCRIEKTSVTGTSNGNLPALTRYGWLLADMISDDELHQESAAPLLTEAIPPLEQIIAPVDQAGLFTAAQSPSASTTPHNADKTEQPESTLPPPPEVETRSGLQLHLSGWRIALTALGAIILFISHGRSNMTSLVYQYGILAGAIPATVGIVALWGAVHFWRLKQRIENTPTSKARSAAMGMIEVSGRAQRMYALVSPISQLPCVYYCLKKYQRSKRNDTWHVTQVTSSGNVPFVLTDDTGSILIDPQGAQLKPQFSTEGVPGQSNILFSSASESNHYEKWKEEVLHEGCNLYVLGFARSVDDNGSAKNISHSVAKKLRDLKSDKAAMQAYDADNDGHISTAEWDRARSDMEQQALREKLHNSQQRSNKQLLIGAPPQKGLPFIIAETASETHLTRNYSWYAPVLLFVALISIIVALRNAANYFHLF